MENKWMNGQLDQYLIINVFFSRPLYYVGMTIFEEFHMCETLQVDDTVIASWLKVQPL